MTAVGLAELEWIPLGRLLVDARLISNDELEQALDVKERTGGRLGEIVVELGFAGERDIAGALAEQYELEFIDLAHTRPEAAAVARLSEALARRYDAVPVRELSDGTLLLVVSDPTNLRAADDLRLALGSKFRLAVADPSSIKAALARAYRPAFDLRAVERPLDEHAPAEVADIRDLASSTPTINLVNSLLTGAVEDRASDIHFEPHAGDMLVRARVDGVMRRLAVVPRHMQAALASRLKIMGGLDIAERRLPQDGRVSVRFGGDPIDLRIAVVPTTHGEQVVLRLVNRDERRLTMADLGLAADTEQILRRAVAQPYGGLIVCGPTGSGKTTTLYAALDALNSSERVCMTIEDPVEHRIDGVAQVEVKPKAGLTFARGLRTILRSDPDVLLVGEIRDEETARIAVQAAMTGHLLLTSLHAPSASSAIARLKDMGIEPGLLASALNCIVAQRLARALCPECKEPYEASAEELVELGDLGAHGTVLHRVGGCTKCDGTGYRGRVGIYEVLPVLGEIRALVERSAEEIFAAATRAGMRSLRADGLRLCLEGVCSLDEIRRVTGDRLA